MKKDTNQRLHENAAKQPRRLRAQKSTFAVIFIIQKGKIRDDGTVPIVARITVNGEMVHFATRMYIHPDRWQPKDYRTTGKTKEEKQINEMLEELRVLIRRKYDEMLRREEVITAGKLKNAITGLDQNATTLLQVCDRFIEDYTDLLKTEQCCRETYLRYKLTRNRLAEFMQARYRLPDMAVKELHPRFATDFDRWLRMNYRLTNNSTMKLMRQLKTMLHVGYLNGWSKNDPLAGYKLHFEKVDRGYLTDEELDRLANKVFAMKRLEVIRDLFLFSCYTGLAYIDLKHLSADMLRRWPDGNLWIDTKRQKTDVPVHVRLLDVPIRLIEKYDGTAKGRLLFPVPSNQKVNSYLKEIASVCGIDKDLTSHMARHTFATTVTLANGVPIETVSKMLGHTNIQTTQIYARVIDTKINNDMEILAGKLNAKAMIRPTTVMAGL
ncbi:MAG: site-specific integrase [Alistipes sp.]|nr:site-specific integrase [Alistipes sp.]